MPYSLGIDIGGTFTDLVLFEPSIGKQYNFKLLTTPDRPSEAVLRGTQTIIERAGIDPSEVSRVVHATTLFTNALIERKGAVTGLIATEGFGDVLEIGRERKFELYDIFIEMPQALVPRALRREVTERISPNGDVEVPINLNELKVAVDALLKQGVTSLAIAFLHAYANPVHEQQAAEFIRANYPEISVSASSEVAPEIREYERSSTTVANAYVKPLAETYLTELEHRIKEMGIFAPLYLMVSSGGLTNIREARRNPIQLLESGPAGGTLAAAFFGNRSNVTNVLAFDMGGTTAKLSVVDDGEPLISYKFEAARTQRFKEGSGLPIKISTIELIEIGAGGGSIAYLDQMGLMKVGPQSAGSQPGPACYGLGGEDATVTDANLTLGYLNPDFFAGGTMQVSKEAAHAALSTLAESSNLDAAQVAWGIHDIVNENMASAARVHIAERGKDTRKYSLVTTGGGGPLHGYQVAKKLGLTKLVCPPGAGVASAVGLLIAPARVDRVATMARVVHDIDWGKLEETFTGLENECLEVVGETVPDFKEVKIRRLADMRYTGQGFELVIELPEGPYTELALDAVLEKFRVAYRKVFILNPPTDQIEIINVRVTVSVETGSARLRRSDDGDTPEAAIKHHRSVYFPENKGFAETPIYDRARLPGDYDIPGPAVIEEPESTLIVGPGGSFTLDSSGNIIVTIPN